jgi:hypothetical protein
MNSLSFIGLDWHPDQRSSEAAFFSCRGTRVSQLVHAGATLGFTTLGA